MQIKFGENQREFPSPVSVLDVLKSFDRDVLKKTLAAKVNGVEVDLSKQLENGRDEVLSVEPILADTRDGLEVLRHSTSHLLAAALLELFPGTQLGIRPARVDDPRCGVFCEFVAPRQLSEDALPAIEKKMRELPKKNLAYRREEVEKGKILDIFKGR